MARLSYMLSVAVAVLAAFLGFTSCEALVEEVMEVSVKTSVVGGDSGQMFVSVKCDGEWTLSLTSGTGTVDWARLCVTSGSGDLNNVVLSYEKNTTNGSRSMMIDLVSGTSKVSCKVTQTAEVSDSGNGSGNGSGSSSGDGPDGGMNLSSTGWLELPDMGDSSLDYYTHSFTMGGKKYRNYSFGWSQKDLVSLWVAYPLCKMYSSGSAGRTDEWAYDPLLGSSSSNPGPGYGGDYARGHQLPSGDRQCCVEANQQTFYGTNITPQLNSHNGGIWLDLENKVRTLADKADTMYVVTGCVVKNSTTFTQDTDKRKMTVPTAYFKALLRYSKSSTLGQWNMAGFYLEHRSYNEALSKKHCMSIDELEKITGLDFFVNLPAKIGKDQAAQLEAADPADSNIWW